MMRGLTSSVFALAVALAPVPALTQSGPVTRADTLGANFDPDAPGTGTPADFDFLVGDWTFRFQNRSSPTAFGPVITGTWKVRKAPAGYIEDVWTLGTGEPTLTWRSFNHKRKLWEFQGLKTSRGSWDPGLAWSNGNERFVVQTFAETTRARIRYQRVTTDHFLWRADVSIDGGKTWIPDAWILEADRAAK